MLVRVVFTVARDKGVPYYVDMNVTLSLDDELVKKLRKIAVGRDTTLTAMIREYLEQVAAADAAFGRKRLGRGRWRGVSNSSSSRSGSGRGSEQSCMSAPDFLDTNVLVSA